MRLDTLTAAVAITLSCPSIVAATTAAETALRNAPMPHAILGGAGKVVKVHRARLDGYSDTSLGSVQELKAAVARCVKHKGAAARPPSIWPDHTHSMRHEDYITPTRAIRYSRAVTYIMHPGDCSLLESTSVKAELRSNKGSCRIDIEAKTASGVCDANGHADGPANDVAAARTLRKHFPTYPYAHIPLSVAAQNVPKEVSEKLALQRRASKTILGIKCFVWPWIIPEQGTQCVYQFDAGAVTYVSPGLVLEIAAKEHFTMNAVEAELDSSVPEAVFAPHMAGGFSIKQLPGK